MSTFIFSDSDKSNLNWNFNMLIFSKLLLVMDSSQGYKDHLEYTLPDTCFHERDLLPEERFINPIQQLRRLQSTADVLWSSADATHEQQNQDSCQTDMCAIS